MVFFEKFCSAISVDMEVARAIVFSAFLAVCTAPVLTSKFCLHNFSCERIFYVAELFYAAIF